MRPYDVNGDGYDSNSDYFYNVVVYPLDVSSDAVPEHVTLEVGLKFLDEGVLRLFHRDNLRTFKINGVSTGDLSGIRDVSRWLSTEDDVPTSAADAALHLLIDVLTEWPRARLAVVIITVNFFEVEVDDAVLRFLEEESGGERAVVDVGGAVDALEKVEVRDSETGTESSSGCVVCLEEFSVGVEVARMPCLHVFHRDCIVKWLEKRCVCPLCRFELQLKTTPSVSQTAVDVVIE